MGIFGTKRPAITDEHIKKINAHYLHGQLFSARLAQSPSFEDVQKVLYFQAVDEAMKSAGANEPGKLPAHVLANLNALRAAFFEDDEEFETALIIMGPKQEPVLRELRAEIENKRNEERLQTEARSESLRAKGAGKTDLSRLLDLHNQKDKHACLFDWLVRQPPDPALWHELATQSDPDGMESIFLWIVQQPECDCATAAFIFHANNSFEALDFPNPEAAGYRRDGFLIARTIATRWADGSFPTYRFPFVSMGYEETLDSYRKSAEAARQRFGAPAFEIPPRLFDFRPGEEPDSAYFYSDFQSFEEAFGPGRNR